MAFENMHNQCIFTGRLTKDPEIKTINYGNNSFEKVTFSLAVDKGMTARDKKEAENNNQPTATFVNFEANKKQIEGILPYLIKGKAVIVHSIYDTFKYTSQHTGRESTGHSFKVVNIGFSLNDAAYLQNGNGNGGGNYVQNNNSNNNKQQNNQSSSFTLFDDDVQPF